MSSESQREGKQQLAKIFAEAGRRYSGKLADSQDHLDLITAREHAAQVRLRTYVHAPPLPPQRRCCSDTGGLQGAGFHRRHSVATEGRGYRSDVTPRSVPRSCSWSLPAPLLLFFFSPLARVQASAPGFEPCPAVERVHVRTPERWRPRPGRSHSRSHQRTFVAQNHKVSPCFVDKCGSI